jgi:hypothetical protein
MIFTGLPIGTRFAIMNTIVTDKGIGEIPDELEMVDKDRAFRYNMATGAFLGVLQLEGRPHDPLKIVVLSFPNDD